jgi:hypothetical protein
MRPDILESRRGNEETLRWGSAELHPEPATREIVYTVVITLQTAGRLAGTWIVLKKRAIFLGKTIRLRGGVIPEVASKQGVDELNATVVVNGRWWLRLHGTSCGGREEKAL